MAHDNEVIALTQELIRTASVNPGGDEKAVAGLVSDLLTDRDLPEPTVLALAAERPNLLTTIDLGPGGQHLVLCGHLDTKPVGTATWTATDPFDPTIDGDLLYGLGACDMKGAIAAMIVAATRVAGSELATGRLSLLFTADEEYGATFGAQYLAEEEAIAADGIVIGEPGGIDADWDRLHLGSRGVTCFRIEVEGEQGHSSLSDERGFVNAAVEMGRLIAAFADGFRPSAPARAIPPTGPTVNPAVTVEGGVAYGVVPGRVEFATDVRTVPGMDRDTFAADLERFLAEQHEANPRLEATVRFEDGSLGWLPATEVPSDHPLVESARAALDAVRGEVPPDSLFPGATDAAWLDGVLGIPTLPACGPGLLERAHRADEFVSVTALREAVDVYEHIATGFCAASG